MWRVGFGVALNAAFRLSSCFALMVVRGPASARSGAMRYGPPRVRGSAGLSERSAPLRFVGVDCAPPFAFDGDDAQLSVPPSDLQCTSSLLVACDAPFAPSAAAFDGLAAESRSVDSLSLPHADSLRSSSSPSDDSSSSSASSSSSPASASASASATSTSASRVSGMQPESVVAEPAPDPAPDAQPKPEPGIESCVHSVSALSTAS